MNELAAQILEIIKDYRNDTNIQLTQKDILNWANQFDEPDRIFILQELLHILKQGIYISKEKANALLLEKIEWHSINLKYDDVKSFLRSTVFLKMQEEKKSQTVLLEMLDNILAEKYGMKTNDCGLERQDNFIYIDDILATGSTILKDTRT